MAADSIKFVFFGGDLENPTASQISSDYPAYKLDQSGNLIYWGVVNEAYANTHEVWVFSLNESLNSQGKMMLPELPCEDPIYNPCSGSGTGGGTGSGGTGVGGGNDPDFDITNSSRQAHPAIGTNSPVNCKIQNMIVKSHKESWVSGASEVCMRAALNCHNNLELGNPRPAFDLQYEASSQLSNFLGKMIKKVKRKNITNQNLFDADYTLQTGWPRNILISDPIYFDYVIFERDMWPAGLTSLPMGRREDILNPYSTTNAPISNLWTLRYRSQGSNGQADWSLPYKIGTFASNGFINSPNYYYASGYVNNPEITFNTIGY